jgi:protein-tyrosine phosphatase
MGIFNLFHKKAAPPVHFTDFAKVGVDIHSHLIPGLDDGVATTENSLLLIKQFKALGYHKLVTTPHVMVDYFKNTPGNIREGLEKLREAIATEGIDIEIDAAAEYMLDDGFNKKLNAKELLPINQKYILIELPVFNESPQLLEIIFNLQIEGFDVILAHPERYIYWYNEPGKFEQLKDRNVYFAMNAVSLAGFYPNPVKHLAEKLINLKMIDFIGSDMHDQRYMDAFKESLKTKSMSGLLSSGQLINNKL